VDVPLAGDGRDVGAYGVDEVAGVNWTSREYYHRHFFFNFLTVLLDILLLVILVKINIVKPVGVCGLQVAAPVLEEFGLS